MIVGNLPELGLDDGLGIVGNSLGGLDRGAGVVVRGVLVAGKSA
jgi:hypothetical protein